MENVKVGGQAVIEGVMMRSQRTLAVAVRKTDGSIKIKEEIINSWAEKYPVLKKPFFRGIIVLFESLSLGISALTYSANEAAEEEGEGELSSWMTALTIIFALSFGVFLFVIVPHLATAYLDLLFSLNMGVNSFAFHVVDGVIKVAIFVAYLLIISLLPDIKRVFMYHGAEHKSIFTFEAGEELTVKNTKKYSTHHPRCGTSFIIIVLLTSIFVFAAVFPLLPKLPSLSRFTRNIIYILIKIPLLLPIAGISYELIKLAGDKKNNIILKAFSLPGIWLQKITTKEPTDDQIEVAIAALSTTVTLEQKEELKKSGAG
jgi:uncharacterized protein YqhQ